MNILILDDHAPARRALRRLLPASPNLSVNEVSSFEEALTSLQRTSPDLLFLDVRLTSESDDRSGLEFLRQARASGCSAPAIVLTGLSDLDVVREAMRAGAQDYLLKTELSSTRVRSVVQSFEPRAASSRPAVGAGVVMSAEEPLARTADSSSLLIGSSAAMQGLRALIAQVAPARAPLLVRGATGAGKELVARALHAASTPDWPFIAVNCATVPPTRFESQLFGRERFVAPGDPRAVGYLGSAADGTLLLDEVAELPMDVQAKLLRVIEAGTFRPIGADRDAPLHARVVATTNIDLEERIQEGRFRADLYYRLAVIEIPVPALADRRSDIPSLVTSFLERSSRTTTFTEDALAWLSARPWPGNVRQLRSFVERVALLTPVDAVDAKGLESIAERTLASCADSDLDRIIAGVQLIPGTLGDQLDFIEQLLIEDALERCGNNKSAAARLLGVDRKLLDRRVARFTRFARMD